ncbi:MAG: ATP-dependent DNA helicase PcrA [Epulopiscium sp. Nele67-Bin005]|nr:MAG: ATP-dependent DNA helicase PcrA [Epulopiscium sp. Nele67-Bin005]
MNFVEGLNEMQKEAVLYKDGPMLILAGAGSGKTRVLTHRIAHLIENEGVKPWSILAITFTNKAAKEMRERLEKLVDEQASKDMWVSTFHSMCVRILRRDADKLGYEKYFTIYDTSDQKAVIKEAIKIKNVNEKNFAVGDMLGAISSMKNQLIFPKKALQQATDYRERVIAEIYDIYQKKLYENGVMDFDDLLVNTCKLFQNYPETLEYYHKKFRYILVDEYQDTNLVQYWLVKKLAMVHQNLCVVGDDDQSIYGWRGADIRNILGFEEDFAGVKVIKLEQNYRSTKNILEAANNVVANNMGRKSKQLWTQKDAGELISILQVDNEYREADTIIQLINHQQNKNNRGFNDFAVLYRTNAQSRAIEEKMIQNSIPYRLLGGVRFYERKEIKDLIAYLRVISNIKDEVAIKRIINVPKRGIGATTVENISAYALEFGMDFFEVAKICKEMGVLGNAPATKVLGFVYMIETLRDVAKSNDVKLILETLIQQVGYIEYINLEYKDEEKDKLKDRLDNISELINKTAGYMKNTDEPSLDGFLEEVALVADVDNYDQESNSVVLMTLHSAKGLEFPVVFMPGVEEGIFPSNRSVQDNDLEEERRLMYVGITRAEEQLYILHTNERTLYGNRKSVEASRFIKEIPEHLTNLQKLNVREKTKTSSYQSSPKRPTPFQQKSPIGKQVEVQSFDVGEKIKHMKFGVGIIAEVSGENVSINFESGETRKLNTKFAPLKKIAN